jgi:hypothetical protein
MSQAENRCVLFVDILGFGSLVESHPIDLDLFRTRPLFDSLDLMIKAYKNSLAHAFSGFHESLKWAFFNAAMRHHYTAITFSDSAFVATTHVFEAVNMAVELLHGLLSQEIPVRIGIAFGSFAALRFKSDITSEGGDHASQFLGTAVVRAHATETCGIKGLRIMLHPSVMPLLTDPNHNPSNVRNPIRVLPCATKDFHNKVGVQHEIDYWDIAPTKEAAAWKGLQNMWDNAPRAEAIHYEATAEAINRMRITRGRPPLEKLRRRTLPIVAASCRNGGRE